MQRPRRTSEFNEELPGTAKKRQRVQTRSSRPASLDRASYNPALATSTTNTRGLTPSRSINTPLRTARLLGTAEKVRTTINATAPHNDKKWVQERCIYITEHLQNAVYNGALSGVIGEEFFARASGGLRQMSIKQFVGIVNYFLQHIWGNRYTVNTASHVDDIVNCLQKLQYPYQVNKSWLKTPNTQHSFGNVIVLLDFFMDFVPSELAKGEIGHFPLLESSELAAGNQQFINAAPTAELQALILQHSEASFMLWDKQLMDEFKALHQQTCDAIIEKTCGVPGVTALHTELHKLQKRLNELQRQRPHIPKREEQYCQTLAQEMQETLFALQKQQTDSDCNAQQLVELQEQWKMSNAELTRLEHEIAHIKLNIRNQLCSSQQRAQLVEEIGQLKHALQCKERTNDELETQYNHQQILLSRTKKLYRNQIEEFNARMRDIVFSRIHCDLNVSAEELQLPLNAEQKDLEQLLPHLHAIKHKTEQTMQQHSQKNRQMRQQNAKLSHKIEREMEPKCKTLEIALQSVRESSDELQQRAKMIYDKLAHQLQQLQEQIVKLEHSKQQREKSIGEKRTALQQLERENEETMSKAEQEYHSHADARVAALEEYEVVLKQLGDQVQQLTHVVQANDEQMQTLEAKLPTPEITTQTKNECVSLKI